MGDINKMEEECTHNCMTCGHGLNKLSDIDAGELLKGLQSLGESDNQ